jgi:hypothetical protein|tara:strand:- start:58 stop:168 length:111 start_codon:yes stop_codon:yes gene_type:complete
MGLRLQVRNVLVVMFFMLSSRRALVVIEDPRLAAVT